MRDRVNAYAQPWRQAYDQMMGSRYASLGRVPKPRAVVECGSYSNPNLGCTDEREDAIAASTTALAWYITRDSRYAQQAIRLMDAWSAVITDHTNSNAPLQTAWAGSTRPRAAEIIKHTYTGGWPNAGRFATMLRNVYLPEVVNGNTTSNGNWAMSMMEAVIGIAVHLEDRTAYDRAVSRFRNRMRAYFYLTGDGAVPYGPGGGIDTPSEIINYWQGQSTFADGLSQETCRDLTHTGYGISAATHIAAPAASRGRTSTRSSPTGCGTPGPARQVPARHGRAVLALRQQPVRRVGDPHPRREPELSGRPPGVQAPGGNTAGRAHDPLSPHRGPCSALPSGALAAHVAVRVGPLVAVPHQEAAGAAELVGLLGHDRDAQLLVELVGAGQVIGLGQFGLVDVDLGRIRRVAPGPQLLEAVLLDRRRAGRVVVSDGHLSFPLVMHGS